MGGVYIKDQPQLAMIQLLRTQEQVGTVLIGIVWEKSVVLLRQGEWEWGLVAGLEITRIPQQFVVCKFGTCPISTFWPRIIQHARNLSRR